MKKYKVHIMIALCLFCIGIIYIIAPKKDKNPEGKVVVCIPVYGQSLALGEEAVRITDFDSLACFAGGRIVTENLDHNYGYFDNNDWKKFAKKLVRYQKRSFELSIYRMAEILASNTGRDTLICTFPGGQGTTAIKHLSKGTEPYRKFIENVEQAYKKAKSNGWDFFVPAVCWMQGESDIADYPDTDYKKMLKQMLHDFNEDIKRITHQEDNIRFICYQANSVTRAEKFLENKFECVESHVPQTMMELIRDDSLFWASGPTYPYDCMRELIHIDAQGQQQIGALAARSALGILRRGKRCQGLVPDSVRTEGNNAIIYMNIPTPPLAFDTTTVNYIRNYGFNVITADNRNIADSASINENCIKVYCSESPIGSKVRYGINGTYMKSGRKSGPRGNLRDSGGNWCFLFDLKIRLLSKQNITDRIIE